MANHVYNQMTVTGTPEALEAFRAKARHGDREFSYWNFVTPPQEALDSGEYDSDHTFDGKTGRNNWYSFNTREWGTKWDVYDLQPDLIGVEDHNWTISWSSAWSHPLPVLEAMVEQHPELEFEFYWEEEQGWGGEAVGSGGWFSIAKEWDIPNSHADYVALDWEDRCYCESEQDPEFMYDDCPKKLEKENA